jgi:hypothetical protein
MPEPNAAAEDPDEETNAKQQILDKDSGRTARY